MAYTTFISTQDLIKKLQSLKGKTKLKVYQNLSNYYDEMNIKREGCTFQFEEDIFSKIVKGIGTIYHEVLLLRKFLQTKPKVQSMNISYYDLYYTVIKNRDENEVVVDKYEYKESDDINFIDIVPYHYIGTK